MPSFLEDLSDACVTGCYFRQHRLQRDLLFHDTLAPLPAPDAPGYLEHLQAAFTRAHDLKHPLRAMLADLQTIEEVRIIEGQA